jgi:antitoxin VapB
MPFCIDDPTTEMLAFRLAEATGETVTVAIHKALQERLARHSEPTERVVRLEELASIRERWAKLPTLDNRSAELIAGCNQNGAPD